jgi:hypothetical protein
MADGASAGYGAQLATWVGFALVKNRQLRRDAEALGGILFLPASAARHARRGASGVQGEVPPPARAFGGGRRPIPRTPSPPPVDHDPRQGPATMRDAEVYLETLGIPSGLPPADVLYHLPRAVASPDAVRRGRATVVVEVERAGGRQTADPPTAFKALTPGERFSSRRDAFLQAAPVVSWRTLPNARARHCVVMVDPDAPAPRSEDRRHLPGARGPWLHALWTDCCGGRAGAAADDFRPLAPYAGPSPPSGDHRYVFIVFEQPDPIAFATAFPAGGEADRGRWDFAGFLSRNPTLRPKAVNFFVCGRD